MSPSSQTDTFAALFENKYKELAVKDGQLVEGTVVDIQRDHVIVDIGFKSEGMIPVEEFRNFDGQIEIKPGDVIKVVVEQMEDPAGNIILSKERADAMESWDRVQKVFDNEATIDGVVVNKIKGGMSVNLGGIKAFLPASQIDLKPVKSLDKLINQKYAFKILKLNKAKGNIVLSRRAVLEVEREDQRQKLLENLEEGQIIKGFVKNITDYGAFVDLGGIDGLLHITDISWGRVGHPSEVLSVGKEIDVAVLKYDPENSKVSLGLKQLSQDPWKTLDEKFKVGDQVTGKIVNITDYGVFVELTEGVEGLVHLSELTWNKKVKHPSKLVKVGDPVVAVILDVDQSNRRISLGVKQLAPNPWVDLVIKYPAGTKITGTIQNITDFGLFVGIEGESIDGLVHVSDLSWDKTTVHPGELFKKGDTVEAVVLSIDKENERFALGIKQLSDDPRGKIRQKYPVGSVVTGKIIEIQDRGVVIRAEDGVEAYIASTDLSSHEKVVAKDHFKEGDELSAQVKKFDDKNQRLLASTAAHEKHQEKNDMKDFLEKQGDSTAKLQDAIK